MNFDKNDLFISDVSERELTTTKIVKRSSFLVLGGAGTIGQSVVKEIFKRNPKKLHVVDISENNLVELVRDLRASIGYIKGEFRTFALDIGSEEYDVFIQSDGKYDYVINLSALKHVRSEKDIFTLMRMIRVNILNTNKTLIQSIEKGVKKYFCVSTDKAADPHNLMGASKRVMEMILKHHSSSISVSTARFANVAYSDGSLLYGFNKRFEKQQPIVAPSDISRYFISSEESGQLCLMATLYGQNTDVFIPGNNIKKRLYSFKEIAINFLKNKGFSCLECDSEFEARKATELYLNKRQWPCYFPVSDTTGEKEIEIFYTDQEIVDFEKFSSIGILSLLVENQNSNIFINEINNLINKKSWTKNDIINLFNDTLKDFKYKDKGKYLDSKM